VKTAAIVSLVFVLAGEVLLRIFHVSLPALKIAGGIIRLLFAIGMVMGGGHGDQEESQRGTRSISQSTRWQYQ
jgi:multiple antibiotic resistance protein